jgi:hypothetical protein
MQSLQANALPHRISGSGDFLALETKGAAAPRKRSRIS